MHSSTRRPTFGMLACSLLLASAPAARAQQVPSRAVVARVADSLATDFLAARGAPGLSIAIIRAGDTLVFGGWGKADLENDVPATARTVYRIGSITKQFTSSAVMQLVERGAVKLDESIGTYLPTLPSTWRGVTVRQLLNHTSGIPSYTNIGDRWLRRWGEEMTPDTLVALTANDTAWFKPGTSWNYDNSGYVVLGMLVEKVAGRSWGSDIVERFAKPLGLDGTQNCLVPPIIPRRAHGYADVERTWTNSAYLAMSQPFAAGALCSTVGDLARWNRALATGKVVSPASYASMTTPEGAALRNKYGFGLTRDTLGRYVMIAHGGGIPGFISSNAWFPEADLSVTVLANSGSAPSDRLMAQLARLALGIPLVQPPARVAITAADRARYVGVYALKLGETLHDLTILERDAELFAQLAGQGAFPLIPLGNHTFGANVDPSLRIVFTMGNGAATQLTLTQRGRSSDGVRK